MCGGSCLSRVPVNIPLDWANNKLHAIFIWKYQTLSSSHMLYFYFYTFFLLWAKITRKLKSEKFMISFLEHFNVPKEEEKNFIFESKLMRVIKSNKKCKQKLLINFLNYNLTLTFFFARRRIVHGKNLFTQCILNITTYNSSMMKTSNDIEGCFGWW